MTDEELITKLVEEDMNISLSRGIKASVKAHTELRASYRKAMDYMTDEEFEVWYSTPPPPPRCMCSWREYCEYCNPYSAYNKLKRGRLSNEPTN